MYVCTPTLPPISPDASRPCLQQLRPYSQLALKNIDHLLTCSINPSPSSISQVVYAGPDHPC